MKILLSTLALSGHLISSAVAEDGKIPAYFVLDQTYGGGFDTAAWQAAIDAIKGHGRLVHTYNFAGDKQVVSQAQQDVAKANAQKPIYLVNEKVAKDSTELRQSLATFKEQLRNDTNSKGSQVVAEWPMCALVEQGSEGAVRAMQGGVILLIDHPQAAAHCYAMVQSYFLTPAAPDGKRAAPVSVDATTVAMQAKLPPMKLARHILADKAASKRGDFVERPTNVFKPGEEIFVYAYFENVGRINVGTPMSSYEIGLDIEVRDPAGKVLRTFPDAHVFKAESPPPFPVSAKHFTNFATAGIALHDPGDYVVAYIFHDRSRPETPPVTAAFEVTVK
ncbi:MULTISPECIES: hypothetical protein [Ensifer]|uniref:Uncharacterized protein n=1 Tax=Ensifer canadensis TaxID=555315 RepID=A0AAW4FQK5_9HYPH|nr:MULTISPECIES: hypothetical protein [Ensifer]MDP9629518.1 hypothetical protein [Ensifer adhaerens]KQW42716.1 hypothetical protein ASD02_35545 [Ensifer sp. Root1252]KQW63806.1 hypothetical protein ASD03_36130 [Ensifer sp. Root127]KRC84182.1 hypothetical protein ASE32_04600 [Ensifer sp. Root231]KRD03067.1 hypothetical protein ASE47_18810 [Ensifer sp. Root258]